MACCQRFGSEFKRPMFGIDEAPHGGQLDIDASFCIGKGFGALVAEIKLLTFAIAVASLVYAFSIRENPGWYPAYLTPWGVFFGVLQLGGSFVLTAFFSAEHIYDPEKANALVKLTWLLYSVAGVLGFTITLLFWLLVYDSKNDYMLAKVMNHGGVALIVVIQGLFLDKVPMRLKHIVFSDGVAVIMATWLALQNTVVRYNPDHDDDDDALYDTMKWRTKTTGAIIQVVLVVFVAVPVVHILLWLASLPKRRYLSTSSSEVADKEEMDRADIEEVGTA